MYDSARTSEPGINRGYVDLALLYAVPIDNRGGIELVKKWIRNLEDGEGWLIFYTHDISENPTNYGTTIKLFSEVVDICVDAGFDILTIAKARSLCTLL